MISVTRSISIAVLFSACFACGGPSHPAAPAPAASGASKPAVLAVSGGPAPEASAVPLRTGMLEVVDAPALELSAVARREVGSSEILEFELPRLVADGPDPRAASYTFRDATVALGAPRGAFAFVGMEAPPRDTSLAPRPVALHLWVRRARSAEPVSGVFHVPAYAVPGSTPQHGARIPFRAAVNASTRTDPRLERAWADSLADWFDGRPGAFYRFAAARLRERFPGPSAALATPRSGNPGGRDADLARLMDTMTGRLSIQEALQRDRALYVAAERRPAALPIEKLAPPRLTSHPWADLRRRLGGATPGEPLAHAVPAGFWFVRANDFAKLLDVADLVEEWGAPAADVLDGRAEDRGTFRRYETELGLSRTALTRALGPSLVMDLALTGSDPYVHEGTDVTLVVRPRNAALFDAALAGLLELRAREHGGVTSSSFVHEGIPVTVLRSADGAIRQHRASAGGLALVSNSPGGIRRVLDVIGGRAPRLSDEPDFDYMLARDPGVPSDVLAYFGDRFVANVVGPAQKVGEARRQLALAELSAPGYAALLSGWLNGVRPATADELTKAGLLGKGDLRHADGTPIAWQPGQAARSRWGTPAALEPLIDLPAVTRVTAAEQSGYDAFARSYESVWSERIDPVALRVTTTPHGAGTELTADVRVLPLLRREYRDLTEMAGSARLVVPPLADGARITVAIGRDARLRRELTEAGRSFGARGKLAFDWVGDYVRVGVGNRNELANVVRELVSEDLEPPDGQPARRESDLFPAVLRDLPVYAAIGVRSRLGASVALTAFREMARDVAPGVADWTAGTAYRGNEVVRVTVHESGVTATLHYSLLPSALVFSLNESTLHAAIDELLDSPPATLLAGSSAAARGDQAVLDLTSAPGSPLHRILGWLATTALLDATGSAPVAEAVLRGDPDARTSPERARELMRAYLGVVPLSPDGLMFTLGPDGLRDPARGTASAPVWPPVPVPGSPLDRVLARLAGLRSSLAFDDEPGSTPDQPIQSLHARVSVQLR